MSASLKHFLVLITAVMMFGGIAAAQNAEEISWVENGNPCRGCNLFQADLAYRDLPGIDVSNSRLRQSNLSLTTMNKASFEATDLSIANLFGGRFTSANFKNADLTSAVMVGAYFGYSTFDGANLQGANLSGADLTGAKGLTQTQLNAACGDETTVLPAGLTIPFCQ